MNSSDVAMHRRPDIALADDTICDLCFKIGDVMKQIENTLFKGWLDVGSQCFAGEITAECGVVGKPHWIFFQLREHLGSEMIYLSFVSAVCASASSFRLNSVGKCIESTLERESVTTLFGPGWYSIWFEDWEINENGHSICSNLIMDYFLISRYDGNIRSVLRLVPWADRLSWDGLD